MNIESLLTDYVSTHWETICVVGLILLALKVFRLPKVKGWFGEKIVDGGLKKLDSQQYHVFHDLYLPRPDGKGTTQIDHLVASRFGLFVIETKNYKGWIFGGEKQRQWTQNIFKKKHKFQNPLHQNSLHINALVQLLGLEKSAFHNLIFFIGDCTFKTDLPPNVMTRGLIPFIKKHQSILLSEEEVQAALDTLQLRVNGADKRQVAKQHVKSLRERQNPAPQKLAAVTTPPSCPKCKHPMVMRTAKKGTNTGQNFWGCAQFPKCRGTSRIALVEN